MPDVSPSRLRLYQVAELATSWRRNLHQNPELGFEVYQTAQFVEERLREFGVDHIETGIAGTGIIALVHGAGGRGPTVGFRADMDALPLHEKSGQPWASTIPGKMHACGHDGHTAMLLGAAKYLTETRNFAGTVALIFQPAEEVELPSGGLKMVEDGFLDRYRITKVFAIHNKPGIPVGHFATRPGPLMGSQDDFDIVVHGVGGHAAYPHRAVDPVVVAGHLIVGLQSIVSRECDPLESLVISVTKLKAADGYNIIPDSVTVSGTVRALGSHLQDFAEQQIGKRASGIAAAFGAKAHLRYMRSVPVTANSLEEYQLALQAARCVVPEGAIETNVGPNMGAEDFSYMLAVRPGAMMFIGNGPSAPLHNPTYDFNDHALGYGIEYWCRLAEVLLPSMHADN